MKKLIVITTSFPALHCWPTCNIKEVEYLKHSHRHVFHVVIKFEVLHNERDIEFISKKSQVDDWINVFWKDRNLGSTSCETMAETLLTHFAADFVSVFEDAENGCEVYK